MHEPSSPPLFLQAKNRAEPSLFSRAGDGPAAIENRGAESRVLGIDIGNRGAVALLGLDRQLVDVADLPCLPDGPSSRPSISGPLFAEIVRRWKPTAAFVEFVGPRPSDGSKSAFAFGAAKATIETTLTVLGVRVAYITPPVWKRVIGIPPGTGMKDLARAAAVRRWPSKANLFARVKDDGRAEAALIGVAGLMREGPSP